MKRAKFPEGGPKVDTVLGGVHSDVMGPIKPESIGKRKFIGGAISEASGSAWVKHGVCLFVCLFVCLLTG